MLIVQNKGYNNQQYHRINDTEILRATKYQGEVVIAECGTELYWKKLVSVEDDPAILPVRQLCGNCFSVRNVKVKVSASSRRILE